MTRTPQAEWRHQPRDCEWSPHKPIAFDQTLGIHPWFGRCAAALLLGPAEFRLGLLSEKRRPRQTLRQLSLGHRCLRPIALLWGHARDKIRSPRPDCARVLTPISHQAPRSRRDTKDHCPAGTRSRRHDYAVACLLRAPRQLIRAPSRSSVSADDAGIRSV